MPIPGLNADRCHVRNRVAARRDGVNASRMRLFRDASEATAPADVELQSAVGDLPMDLYGALTRINALLPEGAPPLAEDQVWVHYLEAANDRFIPDRYMFLDRTTLRNIATGAAEGVSLMNSHRTGGMSSDAEQPFGKTFGGQLETYVRPDGKRGERSLLGAYMLRDVRPNGQSGPSTDDLHAQILGGVVSDVSVGLYGGEAVCDICGGDIDRWGDGDSCPHIPGSTYGLSQAQQDAQIAREVPDGATSYSYVGGHFSEVSAVYDGAVPGAGFRKALSLARGGTLSAAHLGECRHAYRNLLKRGDFTPADAPALTVADLAADLTAFWGGEVLDDAAPGAVPFEEQLTAALDAVSGCVARARAIEQLRSRQGKALSPARRAQLAQLLSDLSDLQKTLPLSPAERLLRLRLSSLQHLADRRASGAS